MNGSVMIDSAYVKLEIEKEIKAAEEREAGAGDLAISLAAGAQKAALQRLLAYVEKLRALTITGILRNI
jgi:hypothetical protein